VQVEQAVVQVEQVEQVAVQVEQAVVQVAVPVLGGLLSQVVQDAQLQAMKWMSLNNQADNSAADYSLGLAEE
jgi:hypothetical protein